MADRFLSMQKALGRKPTDEERANMQRVAMTLAETSSNNPKQWDRLSDRTRHTYRRMAQAAIHVLGADALTAARIKMVRVQCESSIAFDQYPGLKYPALRTDRAWLAQSILNILDGKIDDQLGDE